MAKAVKTKNPAASGVLQSREAVEAAIGTIGRLVRERARIEAAMGDEVAAVKAHHEAEALPLAEEIVRLTAGVQGWCEAHRAELTQGGKVKTAALATGEVKWRMKPPSVSIKGLEAVLSWLSENGLGRFIRVKSEVNKEALLNEPEVVALVPGVAIRQSEEFVIEPFAAELAEIAP